MPEYRIPLAQPVPAEQAGELVQRLFFVSEEITDFSLSHADDQVSEVVVTTSVPMSQADLSRKVERLVADQVLPQRTAEPRVVWRAAGTPPVKEVFEELVALGEVTPMGEGQVGLGPLVAGFMGWLDDHLRRAVTERFGAREYRYPTLISTETMRRCNYFTSFPQFLMLVTRLHGDLENYQAFLGETIEPERLPERLLSYCRDAAYCLPPTMCYHTYRQLQDSRLSDENLVVTSRGKSFRYESRYWKSLERLWDFTIREIVFLGTFDNVLEQRQRMMDIVTELVDELGLGGHCEVANDPFFGHVEAPQRAWSQRLLELKYELRLPVSSDHTIAAGSFNFHERFFGNAFGILPPTGDEPVVTACAGVGLERFTYAFLCRHGTNTSDWPDTVRRALHERRALSV